MTWEGESQKTWEEPEQSESESERAQGKERSCQIVWEGERTWVWVAARKIRWGVAWSESEEEENESHLAHASHGSELGEERMSHSGEREVELQLGDL